MADDPGTLKRGTLSDLKDFSRKVVSSYEQNEWKTGCPIGNLTQEMGILNEAFQAKLKKVFSGMKNAIKTCLVQAQLEGDISSALDPELPPTSF